MAAESGVIPALLLLRALRPALHRAAAAVVPGPGAAPGARDPGQPTPPAAVPLRRRDPGACGVDVPGACAWSGRTGCVRAGSRWAGGWARIGAPSGSLTQPLGGLVGVYDCIACAGWEKEVSRRRRGHRRRWSQRRIAACLAIVPRTSDTFPPARPPITSHRLATSHHARACSCAS
jgi:hypothetical protein